MITSPSHSDAVGVARLDLHARNAAPAITAVVCIIGAIAVWHVVIATALGTLR
jgi:hypothetical protein